MGEPTVQELQAQIAALTARLDVRAKAGEVPRMSPVLDALSAVEAEKAIEALGLVAAQITEPLAREAFELFRQKFPVVADALRANSTYRNKPIRHSVDVAITRLTANRSMRSPLVAEFIRFRNLGVL